MAQGTQSTSKELALSETDRDLYMQSLDEAQVNFLLQRTPKEEIKYRQGRGNMNYAYVEHGYVTDILNKVFGFVWDFEIIDKQILSGEVMVEAKLTVETPAGKRIVKTQFGGADIKYFITGPRSGQPLSIADDYKAAASDALKKCASLLGIGLDLYGRDRVSEDTDESAEAASIPEQHQPQPYVKKKPVQKVEELFDDQIEEPYPKWAKFAKWAGIKMNTIGCSHALINTLVTVLYNEGITAGLLEDEGWLHTLTADMKDWEKAMDATLYLAEVQGRNPERAAR